MVALASRGMNNCRKCQQRRCRVKDDYTHGGSQLMRCHSYGHRYTPMAKSLAYADHIQAHAVNM